MAVVCRQFPATSAPEEWHPVVFIKETGVGRRDGPVEQINRLPLPKTDNRFHSRPARRIITVPTELSGLLLW